MFWLPCTDGQVVDAVVNSMNGLSIDELEVDVIVKHKRPNDVIDIPSDEKDTCRIQVKITGMSCAACVNKIESSLSNKKGTII